MQKSYENLFGGDGMIFESVRKLKDYVRNMEKKLNLPANTLLNYYMMEQLLCRVSQSKYADNFIIKGGFLISSLVGIDVRSTMDVDATLKGVGLSSDTITNIVNAIIQEDIQDNITWEIEKIMPIHQEGQYEDLRVTLIAHFFNMRVPVKLDITTGDVIIPSEIDYSYRLLFGDEKILIKAYPLLTILAEKVESILTRNVTNTRARDFYDVFMLLKQYPDLDKARLIDVIYQKAEERGTIGYFQEREKILCDIARSKELQVIWKNYQKKHSYANEIDWNEIVDVLNNLLIL